MDTQSDEANYLKQFKISSDCSISSVSEGTVIQLRILETTDVHSNLMPHDYYADRRDVAYGLARVATLIREARSEVPNCLLFDNGDFLQGTPISDVTAQPESGWRGAHPAVTAMNILGYDAVNLGNHEFNFGLDWLRRALADAEFPVTCANALVNRGPTPAEDTTLYPPYLVLDRRFTDRGDQSHRLRIGVIGALPPQITTWDHFHLNGHLQSRDIVETIQAHAPAMRADGADLVVVLAHSGIDDAEARPGMENTALQLGEIDEIDVILAGHTHQVFPLTGQARAEGVDHENGTLNGTPAVMAGFRGSHLGVIDLELTRRNGGWCVTGQRAEARPVLPPGHTDPHPPDKAIVTALEDAHRHTLSVVSKPLGVSPVALNSFFALARNDSSVQLVNRAQAWALRQALVDSTFSDLPFLSCSAAFKTGGRAGPHFYSDAAAGPLYLRHAADLYPFPNTLCALLMTGAELRDWLERAAICFNRQVQRPGDQPLVAPLVAGHNFDVIDGLHYTIDLSSHARYDMTGALIDIAARRITDLYHNGRRVRDDDRFVMAVNSHRAFGGGPFPPPQPGQIIHTGHDRIRDILCRYIAIADMSVFGAQPVWRFKPMSGCSVTFDTGPAVRAHPSTLTTIDAEDLGNTPDGFARFRLAL